MIRKLREAQQEEGFTLIELLVVVLIIGILAAIAIPVFLDQRQKAYRDAVESDMRNLALVMEDYASDNNGIYPATVAQAGGAGGTITLSDGAATPTTETFEASDGVILSAYVVDTTGGDAGYCFEGQHEAFAGGSENWIYSARGATTAEVAHFDDGTGACAAATA